jgi:hypothetical protein
MLKEGYVGGCSEDQAGFPAQDSLGHLESEKTKARTDAAEGNEEEASADPLRTG